MAITQVADPYGGTDAIRVGNTPPIYTPPIDFSASEGITILSWVKPELISQAFSYYFLENIDSGFGDRFWVSPGVVNSSGLKIDLTIQVNAGSIIGSPTNPGIPLPASGWYHFAFTWTGYDMRLYVEGVQVATQTFLDFEDNKSDFVGRLRSSEFYGNGGFFDFFDLCILDRALSASEIAWYYADRLTNGANSLPPGD